MKLLNRYSLGTTYLAWRRARQRALLPVTGVARVDRLVNFQLSDLGGLWDSAERKLAAQWTTCHFAHVGGRL